MTVENDFLPFAVGGSANVLTQAQYAALTSLLLNGFQAGIAPSIQLNKVWRQSSIMAAVIAQFIVAETGQAAIDDGTTATLLANFTTAVNAASKTRVILTDTGAANAYAAANPVPLTALPTATGVTQTVKIAHANTGASTYAPDGLATAPIFGLGGSQLQGNELVANGVATLVSFVDPLLNSGNLCWVLYECVGGAQQVAPGTQSAHAIQLAQQVGIVGATRNLKASLTAAGTSLTVTADEIAIKAALGGQPFLAASFNQTASTTSTGIGGVVGTALAASGFAAVYAAYNPTTGATGLYFKNGNTLQPNVDTSQAGWWGVLVAVWPLNASTQLVAGYQADRNFWCTPVTVLSTTTQQASLTALSLATSVPQNAKTVWGSMGLNNSAANESNTSSLASSSNGIGTKLFNAYTVTAASGLAIPFENLAVLVAQTIYYTNSAPGGTLTYTLTIEGYSI